MKTFEKVIQSFSTGEQEIIKATSFDGLVTWIPLDPANSDYAEYLALQDWLAEGKKEKDFWTSRNGL
jgi:hypothetical protein